MHNKITTEMSICQAENGFSLDELVKKVADAYEKKAFAEILKMNLLLTQEVLMHRIFNGKSNLQCCSDGHLIIGAILYMFFIDNRLLGKLFSFVFPLDKLDYGWYVTCGVYVKNKVGRTFPPRGERQKKENDLIVNV